MKNDDEIVYGFSIFLSGNKAELLERLGNMYTKMKDGTLFSEAVIVTEEQMQMMEDMPDHPSAFH